MRTTIEFNLEEVLENMSHLIPVKRPSKKSSALQIKEKAMIW